MLESVLVYLVRESNGVRLNVRGQLGVPPLYNIRLPPCVVLVTPLIQRLDKTAKHEKTEPDTVQHCAGKQ